METLQVADAAEAVIGEGLGTSPPGSRVETENLSTWGATNAVDPEGVAAAKSPSCVRL